MHSLNDISMTSSPLSKLVKTSSDGGCAFSLSIDDTDCLSIAGDVSTFLDEAIEVWLLLKPVHDAVKRLSHRRRSYAILLAMFLKPMLVPVGRKLKLNRKLRRKLKASHRKYA